MRVPLTQRRIDEFDERNVVLRLALGASAFGDKLDALISRDGRRAGAAPKATSREDEELILFVLGLVALRRQLGDLIVRARKEPRTDGWPSPDEGGGTSNVNPTGDLLR